MVTHEPDMAALRRARIVGSATAVIERDERATSRRKPLHDGSPRCLMALREIRRNTLRSMLTTLGIVIGVAAVIALVTLGRGRHRAVTGDIAEHGRQHAHRVAAAPQRRGPRSVAAAAASRCDDAQRDRARASGVGDRGADVASAPRWWSTATCN